MRALVLFVLVIAVVYIVAVSELDQFMYCHRCLGDVGVDGQSELFGGWKVLRIEVAKQLVLATLRDSDEEPVRPDPSARLDMENFLEHLVPEGESWYRHTMEGRDDSPSHMRAILTQTSLSIPVDEGALSLGTWQGIYLFEHRVRSYRRNVLIRYLQTD